MRTIYREYARKRAAPYVANFVDGKLKAFQNPNMEKILQLTALFSVDWAKDLRSATEGQPKDAVDSIVANKNHIAHGEDVGITYGRIRRYYENALSVIEMIDKQCNA